MKKSRLAVSFYFFINGFIYSNWVSRLPRIQEIYGINNSQTGMVLLTIAMGGLIAMPATGWLIVKNGSQKIATIATILFCIFIPFVPLVGSVIWLKVLFFAVGLSTGIMDVAMNAQAVLVENLYKKPIMSSFHAVFSGGMMAGASSGALFTGWQTPLQLHLTIICGMSLLLALWSNLNLVKDRVKKQMNITSGLNFPAKSLWGIGFIAFCCMLGEGSMADWSTNYMKNIAKSNATIAPFGLGAFSLAMMTGRIIGDRQRLLLGDDKLLLINSLIATLGVLIIVLFPVPSVVIGGMFLIGLGLSVIVPIAYSTAGTIKGIPPGVGISMVSTIGYSGFLFGPPVIGFLADLYTLHFAMFFVALLFIIMTGLSIRRNRKTTSKTFLL